LGWRVEHRLLKQREDHHVEIIIREFEVLFSLPRKA
jgi:hypothetical protein